MSDRTHLNGSSQPTVRLPAARAHSEPIGDQFDVPASLLRLLVGGVLVGADELRVRLHEWEAATSSVSPTVSPPSPMGPTPSAPWRYALIGMLFESETRVRRGFSTVRARLERLSYEVESYYDDLYESDMRQTPLDPLLTRLDELLFDMEEMVDRWAARGRSEAERSSRMARLASTSVVDELLDYMARNPEVRELIERQASSMAGEAVDEVRGRTATADLWVERLAHRVLRRPVDETGSDGALKAPQPAAEAQAVPPGAPSAALQASAPTRNAQASQATPSMEARPRDGSDG